MTNRKNIRDMVFVSADGGKVVNRYSLSTTRSTGASTRQRAQPNGNIQFKKVWEEGDQFPRQR